MEEEKMFAMVLGLGFVGSLLYLEKQNKINENFEDNRGPVNYPKYPQSPVFYEKQQAQAQANFAMRQGQPGHVQSNNAYAGPIGGIPQTQAEIGLNSSGDQLLGYQLYQQAVNASTPTLQQLDAISGTAASQVGTEQDSVSSGFAPFDIMGTNGAGLQDMEYQAVNLGNPRAEAISACAQNSPTFLSTSLLPHPSTPGQDSWDISAPQNILATQNFLSATQQNGVDTVMSSLRNASYDIRDNIPNPISVVSPWLQTTIDPDLQRRPLSCGAPQGGLYGCSSQNYVGYDSQ